MHVSPRDGYEGGRYFGNVADKIRGFCAIILWYLVQPQSGAEAGKPCKVTDIARRIKTAVTNGGLFWNFRLLVRFENEWCIWT